LAVAQRLEPRAHRRARAPVLTTRHVTHVSARAGRLGPAGMVIAMAREPLQSKGFGSWLMSVGLLLCAVAGVGYLAKPVTLPAPFGIDLLLAAGMAAGAFTLGALSDRLVEHIGLVRRRTARRERGQLKQLQAGWEASENRVSERPTRDATDHTAPTRYRKLPARYRAKRRERAQLRQLRAGWEASENRVSERQTARARDRARRPEQPVPESRDLT
jgi:hypothetical protein